jgi:hypothetical protein
VAAAIVFNCGSLLGTQRTKTLGLVKPYLSHDPRLITLSRRHSVTSCCRLGSHSAREVNFEREVNSNGPITGPCSILTATPGLLRIFSSGAIRYHVCAWTAVAQSIVSAIAVNVLFHITFRYQIWNPLRLVWPLKYSELTSAGKCKSYSVTKDLDQSELRVNSRESGAILVQAKLS